LVSVSGLSHTYGVKENRAVALRRVDLEVAPGERLAIMGRSGSGKTTLLNILAGLETPTAGRVVIAGRDLAAAGRRDREAYRRSVAGYVWQQPEDGLLPGLTAVENVMVPVLAGRGSGPEQVAVALGLLDAMGLRERLHDRPALLSPLEMQRLAVAVALANRPLLLLADELTARLDWDVACELLGDLTSLLDRLGTAAILVTHDPRVARYVDTALMIRDGVAAAATPEPGLARGHSR
jgi:ABC-type lipoprotein export system ATPase subunit